MKIDWDEQKRLDDAFLDCITDPVLRELKRAQADAERERGKHLVESLAKPPTWPWWRLFRG